MPIDTDQRRRLLELCLVDRQRSASFMPAQFYWAGRQDWAEPDRFQLQFHKSRHIVRAMFVGNGAGKTTAAAIEADYWLQRTHPYQPEVNLAMSCQVVWLAPSFMQLDMIRGQLETYCLSAGWRWHADTHTYYWKSCRSRMTIISDEGDWKRVQGIPIDLCIIDEECESKKWRELLMRRRGRSRTRYVIPATATNGKQWMYHEVYEPWRKYHADLGIQIERAMYEQRHPRLWVWPKGGIADNPGAAPDDLRNYEDVLALASPAEREVRLHGGFQDFNVSPVFDTDALRAMSDENSATGVRGVDGWLRVLPVKEKKHKEIPVEMEFLWGAPDETGRGRITIYERPTDDYYVIGADFAYGIESGDADAAVVVRQSTGVQVAVASGRWGDITFAHVLYALGWYYGEALLVGERQVGLPTLRRLYDEWSYRRIYWERDDRHRSPRHSDLLGHHAAAGDMVIPRLKMALCPKDQSGKALDPEIWLTDPETIEQMRQYQWRPRSRNVNMDGARNEQLKHSAPPGEHDDLVMAMAYAYKGLLELPRFPKEKIEVVPGSAADIMGHEEVLKHFASKTDENSRRE